MMWGNSSHGNVPVGKTFKLNLGSRPIFLRFKIKNKGIGLVPITFPLYETLCKTKFPESSERAIHYFIHRSFLFYCNPNLRINLFISVLL